MSVGVVWGALVVSDVGDYAFLGEFEGAPARWNPCEPIHYVVNLELAPPGAVDDVAGAVERLSDATGIGFVYDGETNERPSDDRLPYQPSRYGERWAPVLIAWSRPQDEEVPFGPPGDRAVAMGMPLPPDPAMPEIYVSGQVVVNAEEELPSGFDDPGAAGLVLMHELGHVLGLGHVSEVGELMEFSGGGATELGPGDREGLSRLGVEAGCLATPAPGP
jgi:hypothetical protein